MTKTVSALSYHFGLHRKFLVYNLILRNLKVRYRKSLFGMIWTLLIPAGSAVVYYIIFSYVLKVNVEHHLLFIMAGIIPWTFFSSSLISGMESLVGNFSLLNKIPLPIQILPFSEILTHFITLLLSLPIVALVMLISSVPPTWALIQYPLLLAILFTTTYSLGLIFALVFVYFRDLRFIVQLALQFWFYLTPIMYTANMIPENARFALYLNPVGTLFIGLSTSISEGYFMTSREWLVSLGWCTALFLISIFAFRRVRNSIVEFV
ncbi:MAG: ABC transporter permease [Bdellovibrionales bacterium]|nr:ABC transporter permease [Bdellovibrionales bacterium]